MPPASSVLVLLTGLGLGLVGAATATDVISLRAVAHAVDVPLLSGLVIGLREAMPTSLAHALEPATGVGGGLAAAYAMLSGTRYRPAPPAWFRSGAQRLAPIALGLLRVG